MSQHSVSGRDPAQLQAIVDMGSNGIRFSITDLTASTARIMPTVFQSRTGISLYDVQWPESAKTKQPIPDSIIAEVITSFKHFKRTCSDFGVLPHNVRVLATEATREAINSAAFRAAIKDATGWEVEMLSKEHEGYIGALGIASSFDMVNGLVMDLGGGSTQLTWLRTSGGDFDVGHGSISLPFGAAALLRQINDAKSATASDAVDVLFAHVKEKLSEAIKTLVLPVGLDSFPLYLSGGGFRGWGYLLMDCDSVRPYPIPTVNGYSVPTAVFKDTARISNHINAVEPGSIFGVSKRRITQVSAVSFLIAALCQSLPQIEAVHFCQGGVREGTIFIQLKPEVRRAIPLNVATAGYSDRGSAKHFSDLLVPAMHSACTGRVRDLIEPFMSLLHLHQSVPKQLQAAAALRTTTTGILASVHGLSHFERAGLGIMLCERYGGSSELPVVEKDFIAKFRQLVGAEDAWGCMLIGRIGMLMGEIYPSTLIPTHAVHRVAFSAEKNRNFDEDGKVIPFAIIVWLTGPDREDFRSRYATAIKKINDVGKKKHRSGGSEVFGMRSRVVVG